MHQIRCIPSNRYLYLPVINKAINELNRRFSGENLVLQDLKRNMIRVSLEIMQQLYIVPCWQPEC